MEIKYIAERHNWTYLLDLLTGLSYWTYLLDLLTGLIYWTYLLNLLIELSQSYMW